MSDLGDFFTSQEMIIVYIAAVLAVILCIIIYIVEKNNVKLRQRHNTRELNKLVEEVKEEVDIEEETVMYDEPVLEPIDMTGSVNELIERTLEMEAIHEEPIVVEEVQVEETTPIVIEPIDIVTEVEVDDSNQDELEYTSVEPDQETAQLELKKVEEELRRQELGEIDGTQTIINYEEQQEENAIISMDELVKKSKDLYESNELTQYKDEGNEPISLRELEERAGYISTGEYNEPFKIDKVVPKEEVVEVNEVVQEVKEEAVRLDDKEAITVSSKAVDQPKRFKSSPIISPIYGIEREEKDIQLENTANYDKFDAEVKKTNEFLMTLKELQKNLE